MNTQPEDKKLAVQLEAENAAFTTDGAPAEAREADRHEALYDRFSERVRELYQAGQEKSKEAVEKSMEAARQQFTAAGDFSAEQGETFKKFMRRDLAQSALDLRKLGVDVKEHLHPARLGAGALSSMAQLLEAAGAALLSLSQKTEEVLHYRTGELTSAGTLTCTQCGQVVQLKHTAKIPPCPSCHGSRYRKGY